MSKVAFGKLAKTSAIREISADLEQAKDLFVGRFSNVRTNALTDLRKNLKKASVRLHVVKNSLARKALEKKPQDRIAALLEGTCIFGFSKGDPAQVSKLFLTFSEENTAFKICGAYVDGNFFGLPEIKHLATLPPKPELVAKIAGTLKGPMFGLVMVLGDMKGRVVRVLNQVKEKKEKSQ